MRTKINNVQINLNKLTCEVLWSNGHFSRFHGKWLRFNCHCKRCMPAFTGIYLLDHCEFSENLLIANVTCNESELLVTFENEVFLDHVTKIPLDWLRQKCYCDECLKNKLTKSDVISQNIEKRKMIKERPISFMDYKDVEKGDEGLFKCLGHIINDGYCVLREVPTEAGSAKKIAQIIGDYVEETTYGDSFEVITRNELNAAYTQLKLPLHQDQPFYEASPGIQILHALKFDACITGGKSILVDIFEAVELLRSEYPEDFKTLTEVPGTFKTIDYNPKKSMYFEVQKRHVELDYHGKVSAINWHPSLTGTLQVREKDVDRYYRAYRNLLMITERSELQYCFRMQPGDCMVFNNRRMLHARTAFESNGGVRHLQGCYAKLDELKSKYMIMAKKFGLDVASPKLGNNFSI